MAHVFGYNVPVRGCVTRYFSVVVEEAVDERDPIELLGCP